MQDRCSSFGGQVALHGGGLRSRVFDAIESAGNRRIVVPNLNGLALRSLAELFDDEAQLFCRRLVRTENGYLREGPSHVRTVVALLGLRRLSESGVRTPFDLAAIESAVFDDLNWVRGFGDMGLLLWFAALYSQARLKALHRYCDVNVALGSFKKAQARTKHLAWFLAGLAHAELAQPDALPDLTDVVAATYNSLSANQGEDGIFSSVGSTRYPAKLLRGRFGTFADQAHSIYALSRFAQAFKETEPLARALNCASAVCGMQGALGQWWWLYDSLSGRVASQYPVLSMHQDGTAPMALAALEEVTNQSFHLPIYKGLSWVLGENELGVDLRQASGQFIWGSIEYKSPKRRVWHELVNSLSISRRIRWSDLKIGLEARPDHFGWLLYSFGKQGLPDASC